MVKINVKNCNRWEKLKVKHQHMKDSHLYAGELRKENSHLLIDYG